MFKSYLRTALRNVSKNKLYSFINVFGLAIGLAACLLISLYIAHELSYDKFNVNADRLVRVTMEYGQAGNINTTATTGTKVGPEFKRTFPEVDEYARTFITTRTVKHEQEMFEEPRVLYADPAFFKMFSFHIIKGNETSALDAPDKVVLTRSMATKYFGAEDPLQKTLTVNGKTMRVSAICEDVPENSQVKFDFATQFLNLNGVSEETWWTANWITYFLLHNKRDIPEFQKKITAFMKTPQVRQQAGLSGNNYLTYHVEPIKKVHLYSSLQGFEPNGSIRYVYLFAVIAMLILLIACANYTNLSTAQSTSRTGEIGMRKVMGASRKQIFFQFIGESFFVTMLAAAFGYILCFLAIPYFNDITGRHFTPAALLRPAPVMALILFTLIISFFAGLYPALILSATRSISVLKKGFNFTTGNPLLRKSLIVVQFSISIFLIIYTVIILQQMHFMQTKNLGYDKDHVVVLPISAQMKENFENIENAFARVPGVESISASYETPENIQWGDGITAVTGQGEKSISLNALPVDLNFAKTMKMQMLAGRDFIKSDFAMMDTSDNLKNYRQPYIINQTLAEKLGWTPEEAIGKTISKSEAGPIVGVVKDFNFSSLHDPIGPLLIFLGRDYSHDFLVRISGNNISQTISRLENAWKNRVNDKPFEYHFLDSDYNNLYLAEQRVSLLFSVAAALAVLLACLGLFGLAAFTTVRRTKEIGIRRVLGADVSSITLLIGKGFLQLVGIAIIVAFPIAWWASNEWLRDFAYRIPLNPLVFALTGVGTAAIALLTVSYHSVKTSLISPVKSLKVE